MKPNQIYILYHPSWAGGVDPDKNECLYDLVTPEFTINGELQGWRSVISGRFEPLAVKGFTEEWQDRIMPLPQNTKRWRKPSAVLMKAKED